MHTCDNHLHECTKCFPPYFVLEDLMCCQCRENTGIFPLRSLFRWKVRGVCLSLSTSVLQAKPVSLQLHGNQQEGSWVSDVGLPLLPPRWCLPGSSFLARKSFYWLFFINYVFHIKKAENGKLLLFNYGTLFFWLVLLESWHNADFSIFIGCSNKIKLSFSSCIMQDWFSG